MGIQERARKASQRLRSRRASKKERGRHLKDYDREGRFKDFYISVREARQRYPHIYGPLWVLNYLTQEDVSEPGTVITSGGRLALT